MIEKYCEIPRYYTENDNYPNPVTQTLLEFLSFSVRCMSVLPVSMGALGAKGASYYHVPRLSHKCTERKLLLITESLETAITVLCCNCSLKKYWDTEGQFVPPLNSLQLPRFVLSCISFCSYFCKPFPIPSPLLALGPPPTPAGPWGWHFKSGLCRDIRK